MRAANAKRIGMQAACDTAANKREEHVDESVLQLLYKAKDRACPRLKRRLLEGLGESISALVFSRHVARSDHAVIV